MQFFILILCSLLLSCELHEQTNIVGEELAAKVINLTVIEEISGAIIRNDVALILKILNDGNFEVNIPDKSGELILNKAIKANKFVIGNILLNNGAVPSSKDETGNSGLSIASTGPYSVDWEKLFNGDGITPETGKKQIFSYLEGAGAAEENKFIPLVRDLIDLGAAKNGVNSGKFTYMMIASSKNLVGIVGLLCEYPDIDPNIVVERGRGRRARKFTALSLATTEEMRILLKDCGAVQ